ncbi:MAG: molecular chaperone DnaJ [Salinarimonadaceae bacterium]|nr:MAG: molecular chaperone DnaJ [Salinarimonadaceae bacterium]
MTLLYGALALIAFWWLSRVFARTNPAMLARIVKTLGGVALFGLAALMLARGRIEIAMLVAGLGAWILGLTANFPRLPGTGRFPGGGASGPSATGRVSRVRSAMIEMTLDHDSGAMEGSVLAGGFAGRALAALTERELMALYAECANSDPEGARLLEAYFDRRFPGWREDAKTDRDAGPRGEAKTGAMSEEEAYQILGLSPGADIDSIKRAHRTLMLKLHPDQGGSTWLAARVNQAKDILLSRHR